MSDKATLLGAHPPLSEESQPGRLDHRGGSSSSHAHAHAQIHSNAETHAFSQRHNPKKRRRTRAVKDTCDTFAVFLSSSVFHRVFVNVQVLAK